MNYDYSSLVVPQREEELAAFDWQNFMPSKITRGKRCFSIVDEGTGIEGKFIARTAFIHGEIQGLVFAEHVTVEKTGIVHGVIFCRTLCIIGHVKANVVCDNVFIRDGGLMSGALKYKTLKIESDAAITGKFERRTLVSDQDSQGWAAETALAGI
ncbi:MAG: polymer-forming cytoskeletal protein [Pseudomonadota bacterium]